MTDESAEGLADAMLNGFEELRAQEGLESDEGEIDEAGRGPGPK